MASFVVTETDIEEGWLAISEMILVIMLNHIPLKTQKTYFWNHYQQILNQQQQVQSIAHQTNPNFMEIFNEILSKVDPNIVKIYFLGDFNINLWQNGHYVLQKQNLLLCQSVLNDVKNYFGFCTMFDLKQLIESPTRTTCSRSSIIDYFLTSFPNKVTQQRI